MFFAALKSLPKTEAHFTQLYTMLEPGSDFTVLHVEQVLEVFFVLKTPPSSYTWPCCGYNSSSSLEGLRLLNLS